MECKYRVLRVAIPSDALSAHKSIREKTLVAGYIARAAAIMRAEGIDIYHPKGKEGEGFDVLLDVLTYLSKPTYLRKHVPLKETLKFAGILPPLRVRALNEGIEDPETGLYYKIGLVVKKKGSMCIIDVGKEVKVKCKAKKGSEVMVGFEKNRPKKVLERRYGIWRKEYLGYEVRVHESLSQLLSFYASRKFKVVVTTRKGEWPGKLREVMTERMGVIFGSPWKGVPEIMEEEGVDEEVVDAYVNIFPCQGVETVRLEEALLGFSSLYLSLEGGLCA